MSLQLLSTKTSTLTDILNIQMVASLRQFLILLLVLLQTAAPLVHAHVGGHTAMTGGLHLPELEMYRVSGKDVAKIVTVQQINDHSAIVALGSAIRLPKIDPNAQPALLAARGLVFCSPSPTVEPVNFSPHQPSVYTTPAFLSANICRAPPV